MPLHFARLNRGPWAKSLTISQNAQSSSKRCRPLCTYANGVAVEQCHTGLAWRKGRTFRRHRPPLPPPEVENLAPTAPPRLAEILVLQKT